MFYLRRLSAKLDNIPYHSPKAQLPQIISLCKDCSQAVAAPLQRPWVHWECKWHFWFLCLYTKCIQEAHQMRISRQIQHLHVTTGKPYHHLSLSQNFGKPRFIFRILWIEELMRLTAHVVHFYNGLKGHGNLDWNSWQQQANNMQTSNTLPGSQGPQESLHFHLWWSDHHKSPPSRTGWHDARPWKRSKAHIQTRQSPRDFFADQSKQAFTSMPSIIFFDMHHTETALFSQSIQFSWTLESDSHWEAQELFVPLERRSVE